MPNSLNYYVPQIGHFSDSPAHNQRNVKQNTLTGVKHRITYNKDCFLFLDATEKISPRKAKCTFSHLKTKTVTSAGHAKIFTSTLEMETCKVTHTHTHTAGRFTDYSNFSKFHTECHIQA